MAARITRRSEVLISGGVHPHYQDVTSSTLHHVGLAIECLDPDPLGLEDLLGRLSSDLACVIVQNPSFFGRLSDFTALADACHQLGILLVVAVAEPVSLGLIVPPGAMGADIVVAEGQSIGNSLNCGDAGLGLFATREKYLRQMPGSLVSQTIDRDGERGWVLTRLTHEQDIRRENATSTIGTNASLCSVAFSIHLTLLGETGLTGLAEINHQRAVTLADRLGKIPGIRLLNDSFFNEFAVTVPGDATQLVERLAERGILGGVPVSRFYPTYPELENVLLLAVTETNPDSDIQALVTALAELL